MLEHILIYLKGLGIIAGIFAYVVIFNWGYYRFNGKHLAEDNNWGALGAVVVPFIAVIAVMMLLAIPYVLGKEGLLP